MPVRKSSRVGCLDVATLVDLLIDSPTHSRSRELRVGSAGTARSHGSRVPESKPLVVVGKGFGYPGAQGRSSLGESQRWSSVKKANCSGASLGCCQEWRVLVGDGKTEFCFEEFGESQVLPRLLHPLSNLGDLFRQHTEPGPHARPSPAERR